jgi:hypothetical protein
MSWRATEGRVAFSLFYEIATALRASQRLRRIATSLPATLRSRLRLIFAMTLLLLYLY